MTGHYSFILQIRPHLALQITVSTYRIGWVTLAWAKICWHKQRFFFISKKFILRHPNVAREAARFTWTCLFLWIPPVGDHCEVNASSGRCVPGVCKNGGRCVNRLAGGFMCECPAGEYEKPYCEMTTRSFPGQSFITFRGLRQRFHFTVSFTWVLSFLSAWILCDLCCCWCRALKEKTHLM